MAIENQIYAEVIRRSAGYKYYEDDKGNRYCWNTTKATLEDRHGWFSWKYCYSKTKRRYKMMRIAKHSRRYKARDRAWNMYAMVIQLKWAKMKEEFIMFCQTRDSLGWVQLVDWYNDTTKYCCRGEKNESD